MNEEPGSETETGRSASLPAMGTSDVSDAFDRSGRPSDGEPSHAALGTFESAPIGAYLRRQRQLRDVTLEELAQTTRIPLRSLQRLEAGEFDGDADGFVRGFVRTVAAALGLDVDDAIARMLKEPTPGVWERHAPSRRVKQVVAITVGLTLLGAAVLVLEAGWRLLVGGPVADPSRAVVIWYDPVRALAEAAGAPVDPAGEIDPALGSRAVERSPVAAARGR